MPNKKKLKLALDKTKLMSKLVIDILEKQFDDYLFDNLEINYDLRAAMLRLEQRYYLRELELLNDLGTMDLSKEIGGAKASMARPLGDITVKMAMGTRGRPHKRETDEPTRINYLGKDTSRFYWKPKVREELDFQPDFVTSVHKWDRAEWPTYYEMMGWPLNKHRRSNNGEG